MLEQLMKLYIASMSGNVRSPMPHLVGPPGCGKSTYVEQLAELLGVNLHLVNVSRISPLDLEGLQMPHGEGADMTLRMLTATYWQQLQDGDILLLDEFLRGMPPVYNGLLDILTSRRVGAYRLPSVFILGASNSTVAYDRALEDRLLHLMVPDPRKRTGERKRIASLLCEVLGLLPSMDLSTEMQELLDQEILPTYDMLDGFASGSSKPQGAAKGSSVRKLIGQVQLREVQSQPMKELLVSNNHAAMREGKPQYVVLMQGKGAPLNYEQSARKLVGNPRLTEVQARNLSLNLQLIELEATRVERNDVHEDDVFDA